MDIRKIDKGQMFLMFRETNIIPFIEDLCTTFGQQANTKNIRLQLHSTLRELNVWVVCEKCFAGSNFSVRA